jgi:predicted amidohydrolase
MKIPAVIAQFPVSLSIQRNLEMMDSVIAKTNPGDLVLFPEGSVSGYSTDTLFLQQINHHELTTALNHLRNECEKRRINVWAGACVCNAGEWFNAAYGFSASGVTQIYHKINLANHERGIFSAGNDLPVFKINTPEGNLTVGVQICRELRFPEQWGWLARCGAQIILHLNNAIGDDLYQPVWKSHLISRAAETQRFVLSANNAAARQTSPTLAVAPDGQPIAEIVSAKAEFMHIELDLSRTSRWYLDQCRTDVVAIQTNPVTKPLEENANDNPN